MVRGTAPAEAAWINDASARSSCGTECAALERARTAPELLFPGWPSNGAHCAFAKLDATETGRLDQHDLREHKRRGAARRASADASGDAA